MNWNEPIKDQEGLKLLETNQVESITKSENHFTAEEVAQFLVKSEHVYLEHVLSPIVYSFMPRIKPLIDPNSFAEIFMNIQAIQQIHSQVLQAMRSSFSAQDLSDLSIAFVKMAPFLKIYSEYIIHADESEKCLERTVKKNKQVRELLKREKEVTGLELSELLLIPNTRLFHYLLFFEGMMRRVHPESDEALYIQLAKNRVHDSLKKISSNMEDTTSRQLVFQLQHEFLHNSVEIVEQSRRLVKDGLVKCLRPNAYLNKVQTIRLLLFTDTALVTSTSGKVKRVIMLKSACVFSGPENEFNVDTERGKLCFEAKNQREKEDWRSAFYSAIEFSRSLCTVDITEQAFEEIILRKREKIDLIDVALQKRMLNAEKNQLTYKTEKNW